MFRRDDRERSSEILGIICREKSPEYVGLFEASMEAVMLIIGTFPTVHP